MFPLPLARGRVRVGAAPLATSAVYHRQDAPFLTFPPAGGRDTGVREGRPTSPSPHPPCRLLLPAMPPPPPATPPPPPSFRRKPESTHPQPSGFRCFPSPSPLARGRVRVGAAPLATSAVYHRQDAPFLTFPPAGGRDTGVREGRPTSPPPHPSFRPPPRHPAALLA